MNIACNSVGLAVLTPPCSVGLPSPCVSSSPDGSSSDTGGSSATVAPAGSIATTFANIASASVAGLAGNAPGGRAVAVGGFSGGGPAAAAVPPSLQALNNAPAGAARRDSARPRASASAGARSGARSCNRSTLRSASSSRPGATAVLQSACRPGLHRTTAERTLCTSALLKASSPASPLPTTISPAEPTETEGSVPTGAAWRRPSRSISRKREPSGRSCMTHRCRSSSVGVRCSCSHQRRDASTRGQLGLWKAGTKKTAVGAPPCISSKAAWTSAGPVATEMGAQAAGEAR
mmetsp:Transcript_58325/g.183088  ORF Transcript_58325/g.183088 Transcript_58325/m.183088 type:complete len:291 (-) Transcript_58325:35-907(-)